MTKALAAPPVPPTSPFIPFPALYVDQVMPGLSDTEWRILCVVIRQTLGWRDEKRDDTKVRKGRDWLSHRQLKERTGKSTDSVSRGIQSLIELNLIVVEREDGTLIHHPKARRRERARLYFKLAALPGAQEEASRSCAYPKLISRNLLLNFNYHSEHHLFPDLPWYYLEEAHQMLLKDNQVQLNLAQHSWAQDKRSLSMQDFLAGVFEKNKPRQPQADDQAA